MAREGGGGGGAFGWTILGSLVGVAGTLAVETLMHNRGAGESSAAESAVSASVAIEPVAPQSVAAPLVTEHPANVAASSSRPIAQQQTTTTDAQVDEDATATGMTSHSRPSSTAESSQPVPGGGN